MIVTGAQAALRAVNGVTVSEGRSARDDLLATVTRIVSFIKEGFLEKLHVAGNEVAFCCVSHRGAQI